MKSCVCILHNIVSSFHCNTRQLEFKMPLPPAKNEKTLACIREIQVHKLWTKVYSQKGLTAMYSGKKIFNTCGINTMLVHKEDSYSTHTHKPRTSVRWDFKHANSSKNYTMQNMSSSNKLIHVGCLHQANRSTILVKQTNCESFSYLQCS